MDLDKSKKYIIMGVAHNGTCSLERYLIKKGYDVIRNETAYRQRTPAMYAQLWGDRRPIFITSHKTHITDLDFIEKEWKDTDPIFLKLSDMQQYDDFPWENKGNKFTKRPDYHKYEDGFNE